MAIVEGGGTRGDVGGLSALERFFNPPAPSPSVPSGTGQTPSFAQVFGGGTDALGQATTLGKVQIPAQQPGAPGGQPPPGPTGTQVAASGDWPSMFIPVAGVTANQLTDSFGASRDGGSRGHKGIDIFAPEGTPVLAAISGTVVRASDSGGKAGLRVWVKGDDGRAYFYAHLSSIAVTPGQRVSAGESLGGVGTTGNARNTPPHLHFSINSAVGPENPVANPFDVLRGAAASPAQQPFNVTTKTSDETFGGEAVLGPNATDEEIKSYIKENFGAMSWAIDHSELGPMLITAAREGWAPARLDAAITDTEWWRTTEPTLRAWQAKLAEDPAAAEDEVNQKVAELQDFFAQTGLQVGPDAVRRIAEQSLSLGWTDTELRDAIALEVDWATASETPRASFGEAVMQLRQTAEGEYMVPMSEEAAAGWARRIFEGSATEDGFRAWLKQAAIGRFGQFAEQINQGATPAQLFDSYKQMAAETLEMDPEQIDLLHDPKFNRALEVDDDGKRRAMTLGEWSMYLREQDEYRFTTQANKQAAEVSRSLGNMFGVGV